MKYLKKDIFKIIILSFIFIVIVVVMSFFRTEVDTLAQEFYKIIV